MSARTVQVGGTLIPDKSIYVPRTTDQEFWHYASTTSNWLNIYGCRTMGKSSLYAKYLKDLRENGSEVIVVDAAADIGPRRSAVDWVFGLGTAIESACFMESNLLTSKIKDVSADGTAMSAMLPLFREGLLQQFDRRVILIIDEYDYLSKSLYFSDILNALRRIQNLQADPNYSEFQRLSLYLVGLRPVTYFGEPGEGNTSPLGHTIELADFPNNDATISALAEALPKASREAIERVLELSGGQPLVTMELVSRLQNTAQTSDDVLRVTETLVRPPNHMGGVALFQSIDAALLNLGIDGFAMIHAYRSLLDKSPEADSAPGIEKLILYGLVRNEGAHRKKIKGSLFERCFDHAWTEGMLSRLAGTAKQHRSSSPKHDKHICVINTGGTLGMVQRGDKVVAPEDAEEFKGYFQYLYAIADEIEFINLFEPRDSINVFPDQWVAIADYIYRQRNAGFSGFVVAHGTDTLAFSASAVAFALGENLSFPVVFTGAQTTPDVPYGDAHVNLYRACEVAKQPIHEVVISFGNHVFRAVRAQKKDDRRFDGFESPTYPPLAEVTGEIAIRRELLRPVPLGHSDIELRADFERRVLTVPQFPGLEPQYYERLLDDDDMPPRGIIIQTLGAGNVTNEHPYTFIPFVERASKKGIPVIITSQYPPDPGSHTKYTPAQAPLRAGAIHAGNMTMAAAVTKFRWVLADVKRQLDWNAMPWDKKRDLIARRMVEESVVGEF